MFATAQCVATRCPIIAHYGEFPYSRVPRQRGGPGPGQAGRRRRTESFTKCPECGGVIDCEDLTVVLAHLRPLPHTVQDQ